MVKLNAMSSVSGTSYREGGKSTFWKKGAKSVPGSIKPVYGAQHPPIHETTPNNTPGTPTRKDMSKSHRDAFQDFQDKTKDAWDDADDDLILMANVRISRRDVQDTAMQVLNSHSQSLRSGAGGAGGEAGEQLAAAEAPHDPHYQPQHPHASAMMSDPSTQVNSNSAPSTPSHGASARQGGPGVGIRQGHTGLAHRTPVVSQWSHINHLPVPDREKSKIDKLKSLLEAPGLDLDELRKICWSGIPSQFRPTTWKILSGYLPPSLDRRDLTLQRKRQEYYNFVEQYYHTRHEDIHADTFRQIHIDIPRMSPLVPLFQQEVIQVIFERMLYIWAIRHPASGYVQGINDLVTPFFVVFLHEYVSPDADVDNYDVSKLSEEHQHRLEADSFWCFSKLMDGIQDNYTFAQPGIQNRVRALKDLIGRIDNGLHQHLEHHHVEYLQFSFRWMNNLLMREMPLRCVVRLWDTYLCEQDGFANFHLYVCAAFLTRFSQDLKREKDFHGLMIMLQNLPTLNWTNEEIGLMVAEAFKLKYMFADAPNHLLQKQ